MASRIDQCWIGNTSPLTVTQSGSTVAIGLEPDETGWLTATEEVCSRLTDALNAAFAATWTVARNPATGVIDIGSNTVFDIGLEPGWAEWAGFTSTTYLATTGIASEETPPHFTDGVRVGMTLPVRFFNREVSGNQRPTVWASHWAWDLTVTTDDETILRVMRTPFTVHNGNDAPWDLEYRNGYVTIRPLWNQLTRRNAANSIGTWGEYTLRGIWLDQTLEA